MISILIATKNRSEKIVSCVHSLLRSSSTHFELIVIDQSRTTQTHDAIASLRDKRIIYLRQAVIGKSRALNWGVHKARGNIIALTDDDCIVHRDWLRSIEIAFDKHSDVPAVFGRTLPYQPILHKGETCPCIFNKSKTTLITKPCLHYKHIGFGNNMAIRTSIVKKLGGFKEWLGPGSIGSNAEDAEFALRMLVKGHKILYDPSITVYHNKWLTQKKMKKQNLSYTCGEMACYGYFHFLGHRFATPVVFSNIRNSYHKTKRIAKQIITIQWTGKLWQDARDILLEAFYRSWGLLIARYFSLVDPIR